MKSLYLDFNKQWREHKYKCDRTNYSYYTDSIYDPKVCILIDKYIEDSYIYFGLKLKFKFVHVLYIKRPGLW